MDLKLIENYFPQGIAKGESFLGREKEIVCLTKNILSNHHTLLLAPRRFGKTSLVTYTLDKMDVPHAKLDLYLALSAKSVEKKILRSLTDLIKTLSKKNEYLLKIIQQYFQHNKIKWKIGLRGIAEIELEPEVGSDTPDNILTGLLLADHALAKKGKRAVLFIDEFQEINNLEGGRQIQGAIRNFAQSSTSLVIIFSGSNRNMLANLFDDRSQPMFEMCDRISLDRISKGSYVEYIKNISKKTWGEPLSKATIDGILGITKLHPKRVYNLCYHIWRHHGNKDQRPTIEDVNRSWEFFVNQRIKDIRGQLSKLSSGQLKVLIMISKGQEKEITGRRAQTMLNLSGSSIVKAVKKLTIDDYLEVNNNQNSDVVDPLVAYILTNYE